MVSGINGGTANITYIIGSGCMAVTQVTVNSNAASIGGTPVACLGSTTLLTYPVSGGTWSIDNSSVATIDPVSGLVTSVGIGATTVTYTVSPGCFRTVNLNVYAAPAPISGTPVLCAGTFTSLSATGGSWSSSNTSVATISSSGVIYGNSAGNATISYTYYPSGCFVTTDATVNPRPADIAATAICSGDTHTFSSSPSGGTWSSSNATSLSINPVSGDALAYNVSATSMALVTITYTGTNACSTSALVSINPIPTAFYGGASNLCSGGSTTYISSPSGGVWSSNDLGVATAATGGVVTATGAGVATISYTNAYGCTRSTVLTVSGVVADNIGDATVCTGQTTTLSNAIPDGTWSSSNLTRATVNYFTGVVSGINAGTVNITYRLSSTCYSVTTVTVNSTAPAIAGTATACVGSSTTLTYALAGGTWASSNTGIATVDVATGVVTGVATGTTIITYFITPSCFKTRTVTIYAPPAPTTGLSEVCVSATIALSNTGGTWSSANTSIATVNTSGIVAGVNGGIVNINYRNSTSGCVVSKEITVNALPAAILSAPMCSGNTATLSTTPTGGSWSSSNPSIASIDASTGTITAVATPTSITLATITYTAPTGCRRTHFVTVSPLPSAISGTMKICIGGTSLLKSGPAGGTWSSADAGIATNAINVVTGINAGTTLISYTNSFGCSRTAQITVNPAPPASTGSLSVCVGTSTLLSNAVPGGTWSSSATSRANVGFLTGIVNGVSAGTVHITYNPGGAISTNCISVSQVTVNPTPAFITGVANVCPGATTTLAHAVPDGIWSSSNAAIASVGAATGVVTGINTGTATITYTLPNGCFRTIAFTVKTAPVSITGLSAVCVGGTIPQYCYSGSGTWSSSNTGVATIGLTTGVLSGIATGEATITFRVNSTTCFTTRNVTIGATDAGTVSGPSSMAAGSSVTMSKSVLGGVWSSSDVSIATVGSATGIVNAVSVGTAIITYLVTSSCSSDAVYHSLSVLPGAGSLHFDGVNDYVTIGKPIVTGSSYTKEAWLYANSNSGNKNIISSPNSKFWLDNGILKAGNGGVGNVVTYATEIPENTWVHVAVTYDAPTSTMKLYKNGDLVATATAAPAYISEVTYLASHNGMNDFFVGALDEVRIWNRALCQNEVQNNMNCEVALPQSGLRAYYRFNQGVLAGNNTGLTALTDLSGTGHTGNLVNFALVGATSNWVAGNITGSCTPYSPTVTVSHIGTESTATVPVSGSLPLIPSVSGGSWSSSNSSVAVVSTLGEVYGVSVGTVTITYSVSTPCITGVATKLVNVIAGVSRPADLHISNEIANSSFVLYPNPTEGTIFLVSDVPGTVSVYSVDGKQVANFEIVSGKTSVTLPSNIAHGVYTCRFVSATGDSKIVRLIYK